MLKLSDNSLHYRLVSGEDAARGFRGITTQPNYGLLFKHTGPMTMVGVDIPLDVAFINKYDVISDIQTMQPGVESYRSRYGRYKKVLEAPAGFYQENNWNIDDKVTFTEDTVYIAPLVPKNAALNMTILFAWDVLDKFYWAKFNPGDHVINDEYGFPQHETWLGRNYQSYFSTGSVWLDEDGWALMIPADSMDNQARINEVKRIIDFTTESRLEEFPWGRTDGPDYNLRQKNVAHYNYIKETAGLAKARETLEAHMLEDGITIPQTTSIQNAPIVKPPKSTFKDMFDEYDVFDMDRYMNSSIHKSADLSTTLESVLSMLPDMLVLEDTTKVTGRLGSAWLAPSGKLYAIHSLNHYDVIEVLASKLHVSTKSLMFEITSSGFIKLTGGMGCLVSIVMYAKPTQAQKTIIKQAYQNHKAKYELLMYAQANYFSEHFMHDEEPDYAYIDDLISILPSPTIVPKLDINEQVIPKTNIYTYLDDLGAFDPEQYKNSSIYKSADLSQEFLNWFAGSKVVNSDGSPKICYKGKTRVDKVSEGFPESTTRNGGFYFTESTEVANLYTHAFWPNDPDEDPEFYATGIIPVYLKITNPLDVTTLNSYDVIWDIAAALGISQERMDECDDNTPYESAANWLHVIEREYRTYDKLLKDSILWAHMPQAIIYGLSLLGYDGIRDVEAGEICWVAFKPDQIYSAFTQKSLALSKNASFGDTDLSKYLSFDAYRYLVGPLSTRWGRDNVLAILSNLSVEVVYEEIPNVTIKEFTDIQDSIGLSVVPAYVDKSTLFVKSGYERNDKWLVYAISRAVHSQAMGDDWCPRLSSKDLIDILHLCGYRSDNIRKYTKIANRCINFFRLDAMLATMESLNFVKFITDDDSMVSKWLRSITPEPIRYGSSGIMHFLLGMYTVNLDTLGKIGWPVISVNVEDAFEKHADSPDLGVIGDYPIGSIVVLTEDASCPTTYRVIIDKVHTDFGIPYVRYVTVTDSSVLDNLITRGTTLDKLTRLLGIHVSQGPYVYLNPGHYPVCRVYRYGFDDGIKDTYFEDMSELKLAQENLGFASDYPEGSILTLEPHTGPITFILLTDNMATADDRCLVYFIWRYDQTSKSISQLLELHSIEDIKKLCKKRKLQYTDCVYYSYGMLTLPVTRVLRKGWSDELQDTYFEDMSELKLAEETNLYSVISIPRENLDSQIWDNTDGEKPTLKPTVKHEILDRLYNALYSAGYKRPKKWIKSVYLIGSSATKQYDETSDIDITVLIDINKLSKYEDIPIFDDISKTSQVIEPDYTSSLHNALYNVASSIYEQVLDNKARGKDVIWANNKHVIYEILKANAGLTKLNANKLVFPDQVELALAKTCYLAGVSDEAYWKISNNLLKNIESCQKGYTSYD